MEYGTIILTVIGVQSTLLLAFISYIASTLNKRLDKIEGQIDKMQNQINEIHTDLQVIKSILHMRECCVLNSNTQSKAE